MSVNKVILVGHVGADPEIRHLDNNLSVANFNLATSETYIAKNGEKVTTTEWHRIVLWRKLAEFAEKFIVKGKQIYIEGRLRSRSYDDKDGQKRYVTEIFGDVVRLLGSRETPITETPPTSNNNKIENTGAGPVEEPDPIDQPDDDLPF